MTNNSRCNRRRFFVLGAGATCVLLLAACGMRSGLTAKNIGGASGDGGSVAGSGGTGIVTSAQGGSAGTRPPTLGGASGSVGGGGIVGSAGSASTMPPGSGGIFGRGGAGGVRADASVGSDVRNDGSAGNDVRTGGDVRADVAPDVVAKTDAMGTPSINSDSNYISIIAGTVVLHGFIVSSFAGPGSSSALTYTDTSFCDSGTVGASSSYKSWANAGFTVNQSQSGASGSTSSLEFVGTNITVSYSNKGGSPLELQLWDGTNYWCSYLPQSTGATTVTIPFSSFNTACWDGSGKPFVSGTPVDMIQFVVPCSATKATPFDYCFLGLTIQ